MRKVPLYKQILLGIFIGLFLYPSSASAQLGGAVTIVADTSPTGVANAANIQKGFLEDIRHNIEEAKKWVEEIEHRAKEVEKWVKELTSLNDIFKKAEEMAANKDNMIKSMSNLGKTIRGIFQLKDQIENLVRRRIIALKNIDDRLRSGIFNMDANLADLEEYIRNGLGRRSEARLNNLERLAQYDVELQRWYEELQKCLYKKMVAIKQQTIDRKTLDDELAKPEIDRSVPTIKSAQDELAMLDTYIEQLEKRISELMSLIEERCKRYKMKMKDMSDFARQVEANKKAWRDFLNVNQEALRQLDDYQKKPSRRPRF